MHAAQYAPLSTPTEQSLHLLLQTLKQQNYHFITTTPLTHAYFIQRFKHAPSRITLQHIFGWNVTFTAPDWPLETELLTALLEQGWLVPEADQYRASIRVSALNDQLFVHSGYPTGAADDVFFGPDSYRFVRELNRFLQGAAPKQIQHAMEVCSGAAPAALAILKYHPAAEVIALDINDKALAFGRINASAAKLTQLISLNSNLYEKVTGHFDLIVANPPYLFDKTKRYYRHGGEQLGTELSWRILSEGLPFLAKDGVLLLYTGIPIVQGEDFFKKKLEQLFEDQPCFRCHYEEIDPDVFGEELLEAAYQQVDRIAVVWVVVSRVQ